jgi:hypothetical protein
LSGGGGQATGKTLQGYQGVQRAWRYHDYALFF